jgi:MarR family transcriptional regulator for hemolysin
VRRDEDPEDKRAKTITLTDEGRAVTARMEERLVTLRARLLKGVSREDLETTLRVLNAFSTSPDAKLLAALEALDDTTKPARPAAKRGA